MRPVIKKALMLSALVLVSVDAQAGCRLTEITRVAQEGRIEVIDRLRKNVIRLSSGERKCVVQFSALVDGMWHEGIGEASQRSGPSDAVLCGEALKAGKREILIRLFSETIESDSSLVCDDDGADDRKGALDGLTTNPARSLFAYNGYKCGWFIETAFDIGTLHQWDVIACEIAPGEWTLVDRFYRL